MNLHFVTIELERSQGASAAGGTRSRSPRPWRSHRFRLILLALTGLVCAAATTLVGWVASGGDNPFGATAPNWLPISTASAAAQGGMAQLHIASLPDNAMVVIDGRSRGKTPLDVAVATGQHVLQLTTPAAIDDQRELTVTGDSDLSVSMLLRRPEAVQLKSAYPGATISGATFLADGRLALLMGVTSQTGNAATARRFEAWIFDPITGQLAPFMEGSNPRASLVVVSPDGSRVAYAVPRASSSGSNSRSDLLTDVVVVGNDGSAATTVFKLPIMSGNPQSASGSSNSIEEVHDLVWTPDGQHLLVTVHLAGGYSAASRSRLLRVDAEADAVHGQAPVELLTLPAEIVTGSYSWAPDGKWTSFLSLATTGTGGANFVALCAVDTSAGGAVSGFRYIADLGRQTDSVSPLPVAPLTWSPFGDGRVVFAAPTPRVTVSNPLGLPTTSGGEPGLFVAEPTGHALTAEEGQRLGSAIGLIAPAWQSPDETVGSDVLALSRSSQGTKALTVRAVDPLNGAVRNLDIGLPPSVGGSGTVTARWDLAHGRVLVLARHDNSNSGLLDYWLVQLRAPAPGGS